MNPYISIGWTSLIVQIGSDFDIAVYNFFEVGYLALRSDHALLMTVGADAKLGF